MNKYEIIRALENGSSIIFNKGGNYEKTFSKKEGKYYWLNNGNWAPSYIDVMDKIEKQYEKFTIGGY